MPITAVDSINGRLLIPQFGSSVPAFILRKSFTKACSTGSRTRSSCQKQSYRVENVLPDPEIAAERLALFLQIERDTGPRIIVATRAGLDQAAPKRGSLESAVVQLRRGATAKMEEFLERLVGQRLRTRLTSHHSWPVRCPRRDCRSLFVAGAVAVSRGIFRRPNRIAARVRHRYANFRAQFAARSIFC